MTAATAHIDPRLKDWATETQARYVDAINEHGSIRAAARALGRSFFALQQSIGRLKASAAVRGYSPDHEMVHPVPDTHVAKGVSTLFDEHGKVRMQWVKSALDDDKLVAARQAAMEAMAEEVPRLPPAAAPEATISSLLNLYTLTDVHVGMLSWPKETGQAWDLEIAERTVTECFRSMVAASPRARDAYVAQLGDFLHSDGMQAVTPTSGHLLDQDGRFAKVVRVAVRVLRAIITAALERHERVFVLMAEGNHDMASSIWLRAMFAALYENDPRVIVIDSECPYYAHQHGKTMIAFHHGHLKKKESLPLLFASTFAEMWGATTKRYAHCGHMHHTDEREHNGMTVFQHETLAAKDAYAARGGYVADRSATAVTYHAEFGEVARVKVRPEMLG